MTKEYAAELLPLVKALADGKTLQWQHCGNWFDTTSPVFGHPLIKYRIKPDPCEFWVVLRPSGRPDLHTSRDSAVVNSFEGCRIVHVREVEE